MWTMGGHPGLVIVIVVLIVLEDRLDSAGRLWPRSARVTAGSAAIIQPCAGDQNRAEEPQRVHQDMALTTFTRLPPSYPRSGPPISVVLTD